MNRKPSTSAQTKRINEQQAVLNRLRSGQAVTGARPANPVMGAIQALTGVGAGAIPPLYATALRGEERLTAKGGWNPATAGSGPINVGGQTWYPAQSGQDLVYKRAPGTIGGQYGSILSKDQLEPPAPPELPAAERAYVAERARVAQQVAQDPSLSQYERNRAAAVASGDQAGMDKVRDEGMRIWAERNKALAEKVKPGQSGYEAIQGVLNRGAMGAPMDIPFNPASLLGSNAIESVPSYGGISDLQPVGTPLPRTQFDTPQNQAMAQMYNRFMTGPYAGSSQAPATNPAEATYATATNVQPIGDINLNAFSFNTPAEKRRGELFERLLNNTLAVQ